jgi:hypothetical protein
VARCDVPGPRLGLARPRAKAVDLQNRLGFVVTLARQPAERSNSPSAEWLCARELGLERSRLVREDAFGRSSMTDAEGGGCERIGRNPRRVGTYSAT